MKPYDIAVTVTPQYLPDQSEPNEHQFVFAYTVRITNNGEFAAQVISRHWVITDGKQNTQEVRGLGVVGQQPLLAPEAPAHEEGEHVGQGPRHPHQARFRRGEGAARSEP